MTDRVENILKVSGVSRFSNEDNLEMSAKAILVSFNGIPTNEEFRAFHEYVRAFTFVRNV